MFKNNIIRGAVVMLCLVTMTLTACGNHIRNSAKLFPSMAADDKGICPTEESIRNAQGSLMLLAGGGMGKTTSCKTVCSGDRSVQA